MQSSQIKLSSKPDARKFFRDKRKALTEEARDRAQKQLLRNIFDTVMQADCDTVLMFCPVKGEPDIFPLLQRFLEAGKRVAFPISHTDELSLEFRLVSGVEELTAGAYGIPEPNQSTKELTDFSRSICLVPALGFDRRGMRIGYGKGYYDRFLCSFQGKSAGVAFEDFVVGILPCDTTDIAVDMIITEGGVILPYEDTRKNNGQDTPDIQKKQEQ